MKDQNAGNDQLAYSSNALYTFRHTIKTNVVAAALRSDIYHTILVPLSECKFIISTDCAIHLKTE